MNDEQDVIDIVFDGIGVLVKDAKIPSESYKCYIYDAYRNRLQTGVDDPLYVWLGERPLSFPVDVEETTVDQETGIITFSIFDGKYDGNYTIRKLQEEDGVWVSKYKIPLPIEALESIIETEGKSVYMAYTGGSIQGEELTALSESATDGPVATVTYVNALGIFQRRNGSWILLAPEHDTFDGLYGTFIDPEKAEEFLATFDKGGMTVPEADKYQVEEDQDQDPMLAAGGLDRNRGNAEKLRRYWVSGEGAAKIRWGTPGDWDRCVRHLSKYLGPRAKGYCQLRHKEALGIYTATHAKRDRSKNFNLEAEFTQVTEQDMAKTIGQLFFESDDLFDAAWEPEQEIVLILDEASENEALLQEDSE